MKAIAIFSLFILVNCQNNQNDLESVLSKSGNNKIELIKTIEHFQHKNDTLGLNAAKFIISNLIYHKTINYEDGIEINDAESVKAIFLIQQIEMSLKVTRESIERGNLNFSDFCEYILPYRGGYEKLEDWRSQCLKRYNPIKLKNDRIKSCIIINDSIRKGFQFNYNVAPAKFRNWSDLTNNHKGDCWAMAYNALYPLRAVGIANSIDFSPFWANVGGNSHSWNVLINNAESIPFMGCETPPLKYNPFLIYRQMRLPAKVFRLTFSANQKCTPPKLGKEKTYPGFINNINYIDVTDKYLSTCNIQIKKNKKTDSELLFLSAFSNDIWRPVYWSNYENGLFTFKKMAQKTLYLPTYFNNDSYNEYDCPFYVVNNKVVKLLINKSFLVDLEVQNIESKSQAEIGVFSKANGSKDFYRRMDFIENEKVYAAPDNNKTYYLYIWDKRWILFSQRVVNNQGKLIFHSVPSNTIYKVTDSSQNSKRRVFSYYNNTQYWW